MTRNFGDDELQRLYKKAEFNREHKEVKKIEKRIRSLVDEISAYIGREDPLFKNFVIPSGSFYEDLKVEGPDEFDFMICLEQLSSPGVCVYEGYSHETDSRSRLCGCSTVQRRLS
ncbi:hypothetical protein ABFA07_005846 [Porites harrisoni]